MATFLIGSHISHGHFLDWIIHRQSDDLLQSTIVSHLLTSDHISVTCTLRFKGPKDPPCTSQHTTWKPLTVRHSKKTRRNLFHNRHHWLISLSFWSLCRLDNYAPVTQKKVRSYRYSPGSRQCLNNYWIWNTRDAEPKGGGSSLAWQSTARQIFSRLKQQITKLVQQAKTAYYSAKVCASAICRELFLNVNTLLGKAKPSTFPTTYTEELPGVCSDFFQSKIAAIRNNTLTALFRRTHRLSRENSVDVLLWSLEQYLKILSVTCWKEHLQSHVKRTPCHPHWCTSVWASYYHHWRRLSTSRWQPVFFPLTSRRQ